MSSEKIKQAIQYISGFSNKFTISVEAEVLSVDVDNRTCHAKVVSGDAETEITARLNPTVEDGFILVPKVGTEIIVNYSFGIVPYISQFSALEKVLLFTGNSSLEFKDGLINFNGGNNKGFVKVAELTDKLNAIENKLNTIITWGATVTPPLSTSPMINTNQSEIENDKIKH